MLNHSSIYISCDQSNQNVPRLLFQFQGRHYWACSRRLPALIHKPVQLADQLPGLELPRPSEGHA